MATITFTIPDAQVSRLLDAFAARSGWTANIPDPNNPGQTMPNPVSKSQNAKNNVIAMMRSVIREVELRDAKQNLDLTFTDVDVS